jgi:hypothetical protein
MFTDQTPQIAFGDESFCGAKSRRLDPNSREITARIGRRAYDSTFQLVIWFPQKASCLTFIE